MKKNEWVAVWAAIGIVAIVFLFGLVQPSGTTQLGSVNQTNESVGQSNDGLGIQDITVGEGDMAEAGDIASVLYVGRLEDGTVFDQSTDPATPFVFTLGVGQVIQGWDRGILGMQSGGRRQLVIPSDLAYGERGAGDVIPPNATLMFDVVLIGLEKAVDPGDGDVDEL